VLRDAIAATGDEQQPADRVGGVVHRAAAVELDLPGGEFVGDGPGVGQGAGEPVELGDDEGVAGAAGGEGLELLCVPKFEVDLEFSGGPSESGIVDVAVNVSVDGGQRGT